MRGVPARATATGWNAGALCLRAAYAAYSCLPANVSCAICLCQVEQAVINRAKGYNVRVDELQREGVGRFALACSCPNHLHLWSKLQPCLHLIRWSHTALEPSAAREPTCCLSQGLTSTALRRLWRCDHRDALGSFGCHVRGVFDVIAVACSKHPS